MSGLPASGKSWLGAALAPLLGLELLDKDDFLEALYERDEIGDAAWRERLSRQSDELFRSATMAAGAALLVSYWRHPGRANGGGTPSDWLLALPGTLVEVHCQCPAELALDRFRRRVRHPGHLDRLRREVDLSAKFNGYAAHGPLGLDTVITVDTSVSHDAQTLAADIRSAVNSH
jgi:shikimate kinase